MKKTSIKTKVGVSKAIRRNFRVRSGGSRKYFERKLDMLYGKLMQSQSSRRRIVYSVGYISLAVVMVTSLFSFIPPQSADAQIAVPSTPTVAVCGTRQASDIERYTGPALPDSIASTVAIDNSTFNAGITDFQLRTPSSGNPEWYVLSDSTFRVYDATNNNLLTTFTVPVTPGGFAVNPTNGDVYIATQVNGVYAYDTSGNEVWHSTDTSGPLDSTTVYGYNDGSNFRIGAPYRNGGSDVYDTSGNHLGTNAVNGEVIHQTVTGKIMANTATTLNMYSADGNTLDFTMGTDIPANDGGPAHFYVLGGAEQLADGTIVAETVDGIMLFSSTGAYQGTVPTDPTQNLVGAVDTLIDRGSIKYYDGNVYFPTGKRYGTPQNLSYISVTDAQNIAASPYGAHTILGIGAGVSTDAAYNYFPSGTQPVVNLDFYPWWQDQASTFEGSYTVRTIQQVEAGESVTPIAFSVPSDNASYSNGTAPASMPIQLPDAEPGFYEVDVKLMQNGEVVGSQCLRYGVGAAGQLFDASKFASMDTDEAAVELAHQFGQKLVRSTYTIDECLDGVSTPDGSTTLNCPAAMDADVTAAAQLAAQYGMRYKIQVANGGSLDEALLSSGQWQRLVQDFAEHYPTVNAWESWNEINNTYSSSATTMINEIFKPFYEAIKAANPDATVIEGSTLGIHANLWRQIAEQGGFQYADAIGVHPYTGHNRSYEEQGLIIPPEYATSQEQQGDLQLLASIVADTQYAHGSTQNIEIWNTESGFWNNGVQAYYTQGDKLIRKQILQQSIGINSSFNFLNNAGYYVDGLIWGLIDSNGITPGAMASIVYAQQLGGRSFSQWLNTDTPHVYAAEFGAAQSDGSHVVAVWSDDYAIDVVPLLSSGDDATVTDEYGKQTTLANESALSISGAVQYIRVPAGQTITFEPSETFEDNVALASNGTTAAASSYGLNNQPSNTIDGIYSTQNYATNFDSAISLWTQHYTDTDPTLTLTLSQPATINRVYVSSQGLGSVQTGLRSYDVQVDDGSGTFVTVAHVDGQYYARNKLVSFSPTLAKRIRIANMSVNYSGYGDGLPPTFWPNPATTTEDDVYMGQTTIYELAAYGEGVVYSPSDGGTDGGNNNNNGGGGNNNNSNGSGTNSGNNSGDSSGSGQSNSSNSSSGSDLADTGMPPYIPAIIAVMSVLAGIALTIRYRATRRLSK